MRDLERRCDELARHGSQPSARSPSFNPSADSASILETSRWPGTVRRKLLPYEVAQPLQHCLRGHVDALRPDAFPMRACVLRNG